MYIIELLFNAFKKKTYTKHNTFDPLENQQDTPSDSIEDCEHLFLPLDSTNKMFACKYCGLIVDKDRLKG